MYHDNRFGGGAKAPINISSRYATYFKNLTFENIDIWTNRNFVRLYFALKIYGRTGDMSTPGGIDGVTFRNIRVVSSNNDGQNKIRSHITMEGYDASKKVANVNFSNIRIDGKCITSDDNPYSDFNQHVENVTVAGQ